MSLTPQVNEIVTEQQGVPLIIVSQPQAKQAPSAYQGQTSGPESSQMIDKLRFTTLSIS